MNLSAALFTALFISAACIAGKAAIAAGTAPSTPDIRDRSVALPQILSAADRDTYQRIFDLQERGDWRAADKLIRRLGDRVLMGHVLAQRYLHPTKYRSRYLELSRWMKAYADHPDARRIYKLALRRKPRNYRSPKRPAKLLYPVYAPYTTIERSGYKPGRRSARRAVAQVRRMVRHTRLTAATRYIAGKNVQRTLGRTGYDLARTHIASGWFFYGNSIKAYDMARRASARSGHRLPYANWIAGLSAYRLGKYIASADHFEAVTRSPDVSGWDRAAAAFWSARANMQGSRPGHVNELLRIAAGEPRTFYGIIARRWLGEASPFDWQPPTLTSARLTEVLSHGSGKRALALFETDQFARADRELRFMAHRNDPDLTEAVIAVAEDLSLPVTLLRAGAALAEDPERIQPGALYPVPAWRPREGFHVDRALIFAFMRQESAFNTRARSRVGARGLMQLMPATASFIAQKRFRGKRRNQLYDPTLNISLGQKYILHLLESDHIRGDLLLLAAAYNGGPGNLKKWQRRARKARYSDALMFIESIPSRETRIFIERVLSNLWMYRERLGEPAPSLDALAAGEKPLYIAVDGGKGSVAEDVRN